MKTFQKPLSLREEEHYLQKLREGNRQEAMAARTVLVERNLRLVAHVAKKYQSTDEDMEDLISVGCIGLIKALDTFDASKGRLATYACRCIENELLMLLRSKKKIAREVSLYEPIGQDKEGNEICLVDVIEQPRCDVAENVELARNKRILEAAMKQGLTSRERTILCMRYGLGGYTSMTQSLVGEYLGISRSYVSRIEKKAIRKLKQFFPE